MNKPYSTMVDDCPLLDNHLSKLEKTLRVNTIYVTIKCMGRRYSITKHMSGATWTGYSISKNHKM